MLCDQIREDLADLTNRPALRALSLSLSQPLSLPHAGGGAAFTASLCPWQRCGLLIRPAGGREGWKGATGSLLSPRCRDTWRLGNSPSTARVLNLPTCDSSPRKTPGKRTKRTQRTLAADPDSPRTPQASSAPTPPRPGVCSYNFPFQPRYRSLSQLTETGELQPSASYFLKLTNPTAGPFPRRRARVTVGFLHFSPTEHTGAYVIGFSGLLSFFYGSPMKVLSGVPAPHPSPPLALWFLLHVFA